MQDLELKNYQEIRDRSREIHYQLRERLIVGLAKGEDVVNREMAQNEAASLMRELYDCHAELFVREVYQGLTVDEVLNTRNMQTRARFIDWRLGRLGEDENNLVATDQPRYMDLRCGEAMYPDLINHWHVTAAFGGDRGERYVDFGDIHTDLTLSHVIAAYQKGWEAKMFNGAQIRVGGRVTEGGVGYEYDQPIVSRKEVLGKPEPEVVVSQQGVVQML